MRGPAGGELNSPGTAGLNVQERAGAKTPQGLPRPVDTPVAVGQGEAKADRDSEVQACSVSNREFGPSAREEFRRNPGQGLRGRTLEGQNPREVPVAVGLKRRGPQGDPGRHGPRNRGPSGRSDASAAEKPLGQR